MIDVFGYLSWGFLRFGPVRLGWDLWCRRTPLFEFLLFVNFMIHNEVSDGQREYVDWNWAPGRMKFYLECLGFRLVCGSWNRTVLDAVGSC